MKLDDILSPNRNFEIKSSRISLENFLDSTLYQDFLTEIASRIEQMRDFNEECDSKQYLETRGAIKSMRIVAGIFEDLIINLMSDKDTSENEA